MWFSIVAWIALLIASAFFAGATLNLDPAQISIQFKALPAPQRFALAAILFTTLSLIGSSVWQSWSLARQNRWLRDRLKGLRQGTLAAHETQQQFDTAVQHLVQTDPEDAIASLQKTLGETEQRAALQKSGSDAGDLQSRLDEIRRRQQALREVIGTVAEKRRVMEPLFGELKDRLRQLDRSLTNLETDDNKNSLADRMLELERDVTSVHRRQGLLQETLATHEPVHGRNEQIPGRAGAPAGT